MRYRLRTLLIVLLFGPPVLAGAWFAYRATNSEIDDYARFAPGYYLKHGPTGAKLVQG